MWNTFVEKFYGIPLEVRILIFASILDIVTGVVKAWILDELDSTKFKKGIAVHLLIMGAALFLVSLGDEGGAPALLALYAPLFIAQQVLSILENYIALGGWAPEQLKELLESKLNKINGKDEIPKD
jgi:toxin secretion/phage lysis holin